MLSNLPLSPLMFGTADGSWIDQPIILLALAGLSLLVALRFMKRALAPIAALIQAVTAAAMVTLSISLAMALVAAAAFSAS